MINIEEFERKIADGQLEECQNELVAMRQAPEFAELVAQLDSKLKAERERLDELAKSCIVEGRKLSEDENVLRQNEIMDTLVTLEYAVTETINRY